MLSSLGKLALRRTAMLLKLDKPVVAVIIAVGSAAIIWFATGSVGWGGLAALGIALLLFVPTYLYSLVNVASERFAEGTTSLAAAQEATAKVRDPDGIYQHGRHVGLARGVEKRLHESKVRFGGIDAERDFDGEAEFEYHDLKLVVEHFDAKSELSIMGAPPQQSFMNAICRVEGRTP